MNIHKRLVSSLLVALLLPVAAQAEPMASFGLLTTGNGLGFQVFDVAQSKITQLLERPYRYLHPGDSQMSEGLLRRNLAHEIFFGLRVNGHGTWLKDQPPTDAGYLDHTSTIRSVTTFSGVTAESYFLAPFGYAGNSLVMLLHVVNTSSAPVTADAFANPNLHLGIVSVPGSPDANGEEIGTNGQLSTETGPGGGVMLYQPIGPITRQDCTGSAYTNVQKGLDLLGASVNCTGDDLTMIYQAALGTLQPGRDAWWGLALQFVPDRNAVDDAANRWWDFLKGRSAGRLLTDLQAEWQGWRAPLPSGLTLDETHVARQAETTLRMAQVLEPYRDAPKQKGYGMLLASLPPGDWHIGWVRDAAYAIVALSRLGHFVEAKRALTFFLNAEAGNYEAYVGRPYRVSVVRYFGDGQEEADWNLDGPNVELDGWGLLLWAARAYVELSGDRAWLNETTTHGDSVYAALQNGVAEPLVQSIDAAGLIAPDTSIWEAHWQNRRHYTYTSLAAARGLCDLAALGYRVGDGAAADRLAHSALALRAAIRSRLVDTDLALGESLETLPLPAHHDAAVVEAINWNLFPGGTMADPVAATTVDSFAILRLPNGGYRRNQGPSSYDANEWAFIDLRMADALRRVGYPELESALVNQVSAEARANFDLLPELYNAFPTSGPVGAYTGSIPMVGFGAGAYLLGLYDRVHGDLPSACDGADALPVKTVAPRPHGCQLDPTGRGDGLLLVFVFMLGLARRNQACSGNRGGR